MSGPRDWFGLAERAVSAFERLVSFFDREHAKPPAVSLPPAPPPKAKRRSATPKAPKQPPPPTRPVSDVMRQRARHAARRSSTLMLVKE